jgi:AraC-like DNA-binding protein
MSSHCNSNSASEGSVAYGMTEPKRRILLRFDQVHPVIRIAHFQNVTWTIPNRIIYDFEIILVTRGAVLFNMEGQTRRAEAGTLIFIPPFTPHVLQTPNAAPYAHFAVHFDFCPDIPPASEQAEGREPYEIAWPGGMQAPPLTTLAPGHWIEQALREIAEWRANEGDPLSGLEASCRLARVLAQLLRWGAGAETRKTPGAGARISHERMARVLAHIAENLGDPLTLKDLARVANVGRSRFMTLFREATGGSPHQYIQGKRIAEARRLLADPSLQIKQIAAMTGFEDRFYFSKVFRRVDGLTPTQFRAAVLFGRSHSPEDESVR